jgi:hypothetical protein
LHRNTKFVVRESASKWQSKARGSASRDFDEDSDVNTRDSAVDPDSLHPSFSVKDIKKRDQEMAREQQSEAQVELPPTPTPQTNATADAREKKRKEKEDSDAATSAAQAAARRAVSR